MAQIIENDFLSHFRRGTAVRVGSKNKRKAEVFFMIRFEEQPHFRKGYIEVVDKNGKPVEADYHLYNGNTFNLLRTLDGIRQDRMAQISWGEDDERIYFADYPYLLSELSNCDNVVDEKMNNISFSKEEAKLCLNLTPNDEKQEIKASINAITSDGNVSGTPLTDVYFYSGNTVYPLHSIGDNWQSIGFFEISFPKTWLERFLSVFYSYVENTELHYEDFTLVYSDKPQQTQPTIVFEKVDTDKALYMRLTQTVSGSDFDFIDQFDIVYTATLTLDHEVVLRRLTRDNEEAQEAALYNTVRKYAPSAKAKKDVYQQDNLLIVPQETAGPFLIHALPSLVREYRLAGADKLKDYKVKPVQPKLNIKLGSGIDFLEGSADISVEGEEFSLKKFLSQYNKNKYVLLSNGDKAIIDEDYVNRLQRLFRKVDSKGKVKVSFFDLPDVEDLMQQRLEGEAFEQHRKLYEGFNELHSQKLPIKGVNATLRDYQKEGVKWINYLYENNLGGCLADDMGLGKTLQTLAMLARVYPKEKTPSLIVMPRSLLFNWQNEIAKFTSQLTYYIYYGNQRDLQEAMKSEIVMTTYALVRNDAEQFSKEKFHYVIHDESQNIKNVGAQTTKAVDLLQAKHKLALSGTPIENNLTELYSLFRFLNPAMFGSLEDFNQEYTYPIQRDNDKEVMSSLRRKIFPFMLRRLKKDVLKELPDRIEQTLYVEMSDEQKNFYEERRRYYYDMVNNTIKRQGIEKSQFVMFQALSELRRIASVPESLTDGNVSSPKIEQLADSVTEAVSNGHKVVVFFNFIAGIELFGQRLDDYGIDFTTMTGSTHDRRGVVERFQNDPRCKVMLMTLKTGGVGLNLTVADTVFIFEPWWNKAAEEQAINRLHRIGQTQKVTSYSMITRDTIEEKILQLQKQKAELFKGLIGADSSFTKHLSEDDIKFILG